MARFFVSPEQINNNSVVITGNEAHHIIKVLRLEPGAAVSILDGRGNLYRSQIEQIRSGQVHCRVLRQEQAGGEPAVRVVLMQGLAKGEKMDYVIQKGTELGAAEFMPLYCRRSVVRLDAKKEASRRGRWQRIALEASKQCGRGLVPIVHEPLELITALDKIQQDALVLVPWEEETDRSLKTELITRSKPGEVYIIIGPEGGLEQWEVEAVAARGAIPITLGPRILRTETAGPAVITMVLYQWGDLGG